MAIAYSYIRFSSAEQNKGDSLRRQIELSENYAAQHGLTIDTKFSFKDLGLSAYDKSNITKGALGEFLKLVESGRIKVGSYLLVESLDRLSRAQVLDALVVFIGILTAGITIVTLSDGQVYSRETTNDNWSNLIISIAIMSRATEESAVKSKRIRASWDQKRINIDNKRLTARCPYWMRPKAGNIGFELIPEHVETVKLIFQMAKDGLGNGTIVKRLNSEKVKNFSNKTDGWHESYIQKLFTNTAIYGEFQMNTQRDGSIAAFGDPIKDYFPAVMTKEEWMYVNSLRKERQTKGGASKGKTLSNLFSGLLVCGYCRGRMNMGAHTKRKRDGTTHSEKFVGCSTGRRGRGCYYIIWNYKDIEQQILKFCKSVDFADILNNKRSAATLLETLQLELIKVQSAIAENKPKLAALVGLLESGQVDGLSSIIGRVAEIEKKQLVLLDRQASLEHEISLQIEEQSANLLQKQAMNELLNKLEDLEGEELRDLRIKIAQRIKRAIHQVALYPGGNLYTRVQRDDLTKKLMEGGIAESRLHKYFDHYDKNKSRENRYMTILFKNMEVTTISKDMVRENRELTTEEEYLNKLRPG